MHHTTDDHAWAKAALAGDAQKRAFYHVISDMAEVDAFSAHLIDVFPQKAPGNFTYREELKGWVWTAFYPYHSESRDDPNPVAGVLFQHLAGLGRRRAISPTLNARQPATLIRIDAPSVLAFSRQGNDRVVICLANFANLAVKAHLYEVTGTGSDMRTGEQVEFAGGLSLGAYEVRWVRLAP